MATVCAYCGQSRKLTLEHIWPRAFIKAAPTYTARFSKPARKILAAEHTIRDVCGECNNGPLSKLDAYAIQLYQTYFCHFARPLRPVHFEYDYATLTRWLLKVAFNTARASKTDVAALTGVCRACIDYTYVPSQVGVVLYLVRPAIEQPSGRELLPQMMRSGRSLVAAKPSWCDASRIVAVNSFYFLLLCSTAGPVDPDDAELARVAATVGGVVLRPDAPAITVPVSTRDTVSEMVPHMMLERQAYEEFHNRTKRRGRG